MKSQRGFEQAKFGASRIGANLRQGRVRGEDAFQDDVATDRNADDVWSRCTLSFAEDERRNSLANDDSISVAVAARCDAALEGLWEQVTAAADGGSRLESDNLTIGETAIETAWDESRVHWTTGQSSCCLQAQSETCGPPNGAAVF